MTIDRLYGLAPRKIHRMRVRSAGVKLMQYMLSAKRRRINRGGEKERWRQRKTEKARERV